MPIALVYHGVPHVVMLATPADLEDFAVGFTLSEGLVERPDEIRSVEVTYGAEAADVKITVAWERFSALLQRRRNLTGRTGCGLCGAETAEDAIRELARVGPGPTVSTASLHEAIEQLSTMQPINARTGSVHAAAWVIPGKGVQLVREDVGRHNALDKAIGALVRSGADRSEGYMLITSRASFEMVQKSATVGHFVPGGLLGADGFCGAAGAKDRADAGGLRAPRPACGICPPGATGLTSETSRPERVR